MKLETICVLLQHSPSLHLDTHTHRDRRALLCAVNTTPLKHKREQEIDVEKTIPQKSLSFIPILSFYISGAQILLSLGPLPVCKTGLPRDSQ